MHTALHAHFSQHSARCVTLHIGSRLEPRLNTFCVPQKHSLSSISWPSALEGFQQGRRIGGREEPRQGDQAGDEPERRVEDPQMESSRSR